MKKVVLSISVLSCIALGVTGCYNDKYDQLYPAAPVTTCDTTAVSYATVIVPILNQSCNISGCHDPAGASTSGFDFTVYNTLKRQGTNGNLVGDISWASGHNAMPKSGSKISDCDINKITAWVNQGCPM